MSFRADQCREIRKETFVSLPSLAVKSLGAGQEERWYHRELQIQASAAWILQAIQSSGVMLFL